MENGNIVTKDLYFIITILKHTHWNNVQIGWYQSARTTNFCFWELNSINAKCVQGRPLGTYEHFFIYLFSNNSLSINHLPIPC